MFPIFHFIILLINSLKYTRITVQRTKQKKKPLYVLTTWVGFLEVHFEVGVKLIPTHLKLVRIMLET